MSDVELDWRERRERVGVRRLEGVEWGKSAI